MRRIAAILLAAGMVVAASACGSGQAISDSAATDLQARVSAIRTFAETGQPEQSAAGLAELRTVVASLRASGDIDAHRADEVLAAALSVEQQLALVTTTTTTSTAPPPSTQAPRAESPKRGKDDKPSKDDGD